MKCSHPISNEGAATSPLPSLICQAITLQLWSCSRCRLTLLCCYSGQVRNICCFCIGTQMARCILFIALGMRNETILFYRFKEFVCRSPVGCHKIIHWINLYRSVDETNDDRSNETTTLQCINVYNSVKKTKLK